MAKQLSQAEAFVLEQSQAGFPDTRWSLIDVLAKGDDRQRNEAASTLAQTYWPAIYAFVRHSGKSRDESVELTQAFFTEVIVQRKLFERADATCGSLRSLVLVALKRFVIDQYRREHVPVRRWRVALDDVEYEECLLGHGSSRPEDSFMRRWAMAVLEESLRRCEAHYTATGKASHWLAFEARVITPSLSMHAAPSHHEVAVSLGLEGPAASIMAIRVVRKRLLALIQQVLAESTRDSAERDAEYRDIVSLIS